MATEKSDNDGVPQELKDEVDRIRHQEGGGDADEEESGEEVVKLSRRQVKKQQESEEKAAKEARDQELLESARTAAEESKKLREERAKDAERMARLEGMIESSINQRPIVQQQRDPDPEPGESVYRKKMREATVSLQAGKLDEYHESVREANEALVNEKLRAMQQHMMQQQPRQQQFNKPEWVTAVESQFPDVLMHPNGINSVVAFHNILFPNRQPNAESLLKAYQRSKVELGLEKKDETQEKKVEQKRQMLSGSRVNSNGRTSKGSDDIDVEVPKNYKQIARASGMTPEQYLRAAAEDPRNVKRK
jgi:hypothetical protein